MRFFLILTDTRKAPQGVRYTCGISRVEKFGHLQPPVWQYRLGIQLHQYHPAKDGPSIELAAAPWSRQCHHRLFQAWTAGVWWSSRAVERQSSILSYAVHRGVSSRISGVQTRRNRCLKPETWGSFFASLPGKQDAWRTNRHAGYIWGFGTYRHELHNVLPQSGHYRPQVLSDGHGAG